MRRTLVAAAWCFAVVATAAAGDIGFVEDFALAKDRAATLKQLIPGTEPYYYFHCLHYLNSGQRDKADALFKTWEARLPSSSLQKEMQIRLALLSYEKDPQRTLDFLKKRLDLKFDHQRKLDGVAPDLPTALDPKLISRETLKAKFLQQKENVDNFATSAFDWLASENLTWQQRRDLLKRLERPDIPNLPRLIVEDLMVPDHPCQFGDYPIHQQLTLDQLEEVLRLKPDLRDNSKLVTIWLAKLQPGADEHWRRNPAQTRAYLDRLLTFVRKLAPVHNSLKAHVLNYRLSFDTSQGTYDRSLFLEYLSLPRQQSYMAKALLESPDANRFPAKLDADAQTQLPSVGEDEPLVRDYLKHFLASAESAQEFAPYINDVYLRHLFAETKIEQGLGTPEQWASQLPPEQFRALRDRVDIDFDPTNKTHYKADEPVTLTLHLKNVPTLIVKVFEINTRQFYQTQLKEVDSDINLDGLVANSEETQHYTESPLRRITRRFSFPQLSKPGVYVIDFIGNGRSSRALISKGRLQPLVKVSSAGQVVYVVDDERQPVKDATLWLGGREYTPDKDGGILIPFGIDSVVRPIVLSRGDFSCLTEVHHQIESYRFVAGIHVDRESLLAQRVAPVLVRPGLFLFGEPMPVSLLEDVRLRLEATDHDGIVSRTEVPNFKLHMNKESVYEFRVPPRLSELKVTLLAKVKSLSLNKLESVEDSWRYYVNGIDELSRTEDIHFAKFANDYVLELLGRNGESKSSQIVEVDMKHRDFTEKIHTILKTDSQGRITLGPLTDIESIEANTPNGAKRQWELGEDRYTYPPAINARAGEVVRLPYLGRANQPNRTEFALFELRGGAVNADYFDAIRLRGGMIEIHGLNPGDYVLWARHCNARLQIRIVDGPEYAGFVLGSTRILELPKLPALQVATVSEQNEQIIIRLENATPLTRVHVNATRYYPEFDMHFTFSRVREGSLSCEKYIKAYSWCYISHRISDEYRYVLERRMQKKFPGNMLERPQLLLNPWAQRIAQGGEKMSERGEDSSPGGPSHLAADLDIGESMLRVRPGTYKSASSNLDFLAETSTVLANFTPDKDGVVKINRKQLGSHAWVHVVAVDPLQTVSRSFALPEQPAKFLDLRLRQGLDPAKHFTQQKQVSLLAAGQTFTLDDLASSRFEAYDSLPKVFALYATLANDRKLFEFTFLLNWPKFKPEEKREHYSKHACHELNFFLYHKDAEFFRTVVRPYLANKKGKTFLDHWLLEEDLTRYLRPWQYDQLNVVERILLAQRIAGEPAKTARHLNDLSRLQPPNLDRLQKLFETAIKTGDLSADDALRVRQLVKELETTIQMKKAANAPPAKPGDPKPAQPPSPDVFIEGSMEAPKAGEKADADKGKFKLHVGGRASQDFLDAINKPGNQDGAQKTVVAPQGITNLGVGRSILQKGEDSAIDAITGERANRNDRGIAQLYRQVEPTQEWAENNYYQLPVQQQVAGLITINPFWLDYARHEGKKPFFSKNLASASNNFTEVMFALAVLDLPFEAGKHTVTFDAGKMTFTPAEPVLAFHEAVQPVAQAEGQAPILVSQNFYRHGDRYREENGEKLDKFLTGEFVIQTVYGCQVVVTNPSSARQKLAVLLQIPQGAMPLGGIPATRTVLVDLQPFHTQTFNYLFYFPQPGRFPHFPVHVASKGVLLAAAPPFTFHVVAKPSKLDTDSWVYVSQHGTNDQVLAFLMRENLHALDLGLIAFRMREKEFFTSVLSLLQERHAYNATLWSYALYHRDTSATQEFLSHADGLINDAGGRLASPLLAVDPVERHMYEHLEYKPLVNARAHSLGARRRIVNARIDGQYHQFLKQLSYRSELTDEDWLAVTYYLLLQDRVEEALAAFARVHPEKVATKMQYDYCAAYLEMFGDQPQRARPIAERYAKHPVDRWRNTFGAILAQLDEIDGKGARVTDAADRMQQQTQAANREPSFDFKLKGNTVQLTWRNLELVRVNYYLMDVELLFSRNPFVQESGSQFAAIRPNASQVVKLPPEKQSLAVTLPENLQRRNVLVEITAAGKNYALPYYANAMTVQMQDNYGQVRVTDNATGKPLPKVYVKTYVQLANGQVKFHKDGYTDHRGRFDYATVSTPEQAPPQRYAVLILSEERGAQIREVAPPPQ